MAKYILNVTLAHVNPDFMSPHLVNNRATTARQVCQLDPLLPPGIASLYTAFRTEEVLLSRPISWLPPLSVLDLFIESPDALTITPNFLND